MRLRARALPEPDFLREDNRRMLPILRERNFDIAYHEAGGAHNDTRGRDHAHRELEMTSG